MPYYTPCSGNVQWQTGEKCEIPGPGHCIPPGSHSSRQYDMIEKKKGAEKMIMISC